MVDLQKSANTRVFLIEDMAGPANVPLYLGAARAMAPSWSGGDRTPVRVPHPSRYGAFQTVDFIDGAKGLPTLSVQQRYSPDRSDLLRIFRRECSVDLQVHMGDCEDPSDFDAGWRKILVVENARPTNWGADELGALDNDQNAAINEDVPFTGIDMYEVVTITPQEAAQTELTDEVVAVAICDTAQCGACGIPSNGYSKVFVLTGATSGSPGLPTELLYSEDAGATWASTNITTLGLAENASDMACVGSNLVIVSNDSQSLHYAPIADILDAAETWTEVTTGFVAAGAPNAIVSNGRTKTWIAGDGGYVYFSSDVTASVTVQTDGSVTAQNLADIAAFDDETLMAVGASNAVIVTQNGGTTWSSLTGPNAGTALNAVASRKAIGVTDEWFVGDAGGQLWYTRDLGQNWTERTFAGSGAGQVRAILFVSPTVGYMAHDTAAPAGRIFRTVSGGNTWYALPEAEGQVMPANDRVNALAGSGENVNLVFGGGLADDGSDGFLVKVA